MQLESLINSVVEQLGKNLPAGLQGLQSEVQNVARTVLSEAFSKMELVTREEFDAQSRVLIRTRERLEQLEAQVRILEQG